MDKELTRYAFMSHMQDYMKQLLKDPIKASTDDFLQSFGIKGPVALKMLLKKANPDDASSSVIVRTEKIKDNGYDENGKRNKDTFEISYKIPRKDFKKKLRNLYINLFESITVKDCPLFKNNINEGAWGYDILDNDSALDLQTEFAQVAIKVLISKLQNSTDNQSLWANIGVTIDFLKKYKEEEIQFSDEYNEATQIVIDNLNKLLYDDSFSQTWSEPARLKSSIKKLIKDVTLLQYQKEIMNAGEEYYDNRMPKSPMQEEGEGATTCDGSNGQYQAVPLFSKKSNNEEAGDDLIRKKTMYITNEQAKYIDEVVNTQNTGDYQYTVPFGNKEDDFYKEACDHENIMKKSFKRK